MGAKKYALNGGTTDRMKQACGCKFHVDRSLSAPDPYTGPLVQCTRPMNHLGRCYGSVFYTCGRWGQELADGCVRFETIREPELGYESRTSDTVVDILTGERTWG